MQKQLSPSSLLRKTLYTCVLDVFGYFSIYKALVSNKEFGGGDAVVISPLSSSSPSLSSWDLVVDNSTSSLLP